MKKITVRYTLEVPEDHIDKVCRKCQCGRRDLENDLKDMAEISGRHRVYEFIEPFVQIKQLNKKEDS